jgi:hypothetical protein
MSVLFRCDRCKEVVDPSHVRRVEVRSFFLEGRERAPYGEQDAELGIETANRGLDKDLCDGCRRALRRFLTAKLDGGGGS